MKNGRFTTWFNHDNQEFLQSKTQCWLEVAKLQLLRGRQVKELQQKALLSKWKIFSCSITRSLLEKYLLCPTGKWRKLLVEIASGKASDNPTILPGNIIQFHPFFSVQQQESLSFSCVMNHFSFWSNETIALFFYNSLSLHHSKCQVLQ